MAINPVYWPDSVAFKRLIRELTRQANYVAPYQDPTPPPPSVAAAAVTASDDATGEPADPQPVVRVGAWVLEAAENGDLIARHDSGAVRTIATAQEGQAHG